MSPSEFDLRTALRKGEGDALDPHAVLGRARRARRHRRRTIGAVAGSVAAVAAIAVAGPLVLNISNSESNKSVSARAAGSARTNLAPNSRPAAEPEPDLSPLCPAAAPAVTMPSAPEAAREPLFPTLVDRMLVCVFQTPPAAGVASTELATSYTLTGPEARTIVTRLNALPVSTGGQNPCPGPLGPTVVLLATDQAGQTDRAVAQAGCDGLIVTATAWRRQARDLLLTLINKGLPQPLTAPHASIGPGPS
jgi:hypothetical protein